MIVIPMAGLSSRFFKAGYIKPKYMLEAHGKSLFEHSVISFKKYFLTQEFLFIIRDVFETKKFVTERARSLGIKSFTIVCVEKETRGQADTVAQGLLEWKRDNIEHEDCSLTIFNIDTFRPNFSFPNLSGLGSGYLEVFVGEGDNWSFAKPLHEGSTQVAETAEKRPISNFCSTGLYYFSSISKYLDAFSIYTSFPESEWESGELYIAPLYNVLIKQGYEIHLHCIHRTEVVFCGVPDEYVEFSSSSITDHM